MNHLNHQLFTRKYSKKKETNWVMSWIKVNSFFLSFQILCSGCFAESLSLFHLSHYVTEVVEGPCSAVSKNACCLNFCTAIIAWAISARSDWWYCSVNVHFRFRNVRFWLQISNCQLVAVSIITLFQTEWETFTDLFYENVKGLQIRTNYGYLQVVTLDYLYLNNESCISNKSKKKAKMMYKRYKFCGIECCVETGLAVLSFERFEDKVSTH